MTNLLSFTVEKHAGRFVAILTPVMPALDAQNRQLAEEERALLKGVSVSKMAAITAPMSSVSHRHSHFGERELTALQAKFSTTPSMVLHVKGKEDEVIVFDDLDTSPIAVTSADLALLDEIYRQIESVRV